MQRIARIIIALLTLSFGCYAVAAWEYSRATNVLGAVLEVIEDKSLGHGLKSTIFDPPGSGNGFG
ncbi:MAG: hypothetical protein WA888_07060 [Burkholderiaceae bacterium]